MRIKKITAVLLAFVLLFSGIPVTAVQADEPKESQELKNDMTIESTDSFGNMVADMMTGEVQEQEENDGCNIFSIEVNGTKASVVFETNQYASLIVGIYAENGNQLLASGTVDVEPGDTEVEIEIETDQMPQYFYLRGFLVNYETYEPYCAAYESPNYTQEMQEFLSKTTADFEGQEILNFDDDETNNFAVYNDETVVVEETEGVNEIVQADEATEKYVIENASESILELKEGDVLSYEYADGSVLILKAGQIDVKGTTVTITGEDTSMEEVFDYVKIDTLATTKDAEIDPSTCGENVTYLGTKEEVSKARAVDEENTEVVAKSFELTSGENDSVTYSAELDVKLAATVKLYVSVSYQYIELKFDYTLTFNTNIAGKIKPVDKKLAQFTYSPIPFVNIKVTPHFLLEASAEISWVGEISGTVGFEASNEEGMKNLTCKPKTEHAMNGELTVYAGIKLTPSIEVISDKILEAEVNGSAGVELTAEESVWKQTDFVHHECSKSCLDGEVHAKIVIGFKVTFLNMKQLTYSKDKTYTHKIKDFYFSQDFNEFAFTTCPHLSYQVDVTVKNQNGLPVENAVVKKMGYETEETMTDSDGTVSLYLPAGKHTLTAEKENSGSGSKKITVVDEKKKIKIRVKNETDPPVKVKAVSLSECVSTAILEDNSLWVWGHRYGSIGFGNVGAGSASVKYPTKILDNIKQVAAGAGGSTAMAVSTGDDLWGIGDRPGEMGIKDVKMVGGTDYSYAILKNDGSVWTWGENRYGELGDGTTEMRGDPVKIMDNVQSISGGANHFAAVKKDGSLWTWGWNRLGELGDGTQEDKMLPVKIMDDVAKVSLGGEHSAALKTDGSLWTWGDNDSGELGRETWNAGENKLIPVKIMEDVADISMGDGASAAIKEDGTLWTWGDNYRGRLGTGTVAYSTVVPVKIMENVKSVSVGDQHTGIITTDGRLWMCGGNWNGCELGAGLSTVAVNTPIDITGNFKVDSAKKRDVSMMAEEADEIDETSSITMADKVTLNDDGTLTADFADLDTTYIYNFYVLKSMDKVEAFGTDNLYYISQERTETDGSLHITCQLKESDENAVIFVAGMIKPETENTPEEPEYTPGDIDENGRVDIADLRMVLRAVCSKTELSSQQQLAADVETDGIVNIADLRKILRFVCGKLEEL